jgi:hypothetical protein
MEDAMKLDEYPIEIIEGAIKYKRFNMVTLAKAVGRSRSSVTKAIYRTKTIESKTLDSDIAEVLRPELDIIYDAFLQKGYYANES